MGPQQRRAAAAEADLPDEVVRGAAGDLDEAAVDAPDVVPGADGDPVVPRVVATAGAEDDVVVVEARAGGADRDGAAPPVTLEDRVTVAWLTLPLARGMAEEPLEAPPGRLGLSLETRDRGAEE